MRGKHEAGGAGVCRLQAGGRGSTMGSSWRRSAAAQVRSSGGRSGGGGFPWWREPSSSFQKSSATGLTKRSARARGGPRTLSTNSKIQVMERINQQLGPKAKRFCLRRTLTGPW